MSAWSDQPWLLLMASSGASSRTLRNRTSAPASFAPSSTARASPYTLPVALEEISRAAGVGKGTLYRRFPNKGVLCQALLDEPTREFQRETMEIVGQTGVGPLEKLDRFLDGLVRFTEENLDLLYGGEEPLWGATRLARFRSPAYDWRRWTVLGLLRSAAREREIDDDLDLEYLAPALLAPLEVELYYHQRRVAGPLYDRINAGVRSLVPGK